MVAHRAGNGGSQPQTQTATVTTDANTFVVSHIFDLGAVSSAFVSATLLSVVADGETFGADTGEISSDVNAITEGRDGSAFPFTLNGTVSAAWFKDEPYVGVGVLPLLTHEMAGVTARYVKVAIQIQDSDFNVYAGPNNPTATYRLDVEYR